jgi:hypothetical protein
MAIFREPKLNGKPYLVIFKKLPIETELSSPEEKSYFHIGMLGR